MGLLKFFRKRLEKGQENPKFETEEEVPQRETHLKVCSCEMRNQEFVMVNWCFECDAPIHIDQEIEEHFNKLKDNG